ncbi:hypothetical protein [Paenibacillus abyssi]|uniref:DUF2802 domain-containing protein n=1 Tax=Paenibacillus abyssi TaxID=1340531 RepID=A0A917FWQ9_9BACL|nr:hypothetical protein [Paenibacillus abyssi]GGG12182.1 hypothetical protein GCM10010916_31310 [Paenibacillus abyssi]
MDEPWIYIVLLGAFAVVCALALPRKAKTSDGNQTIQNIEVALEQFMGQMEADNQDLVKTVSKTQKEWREDAAKQEGRILQLERRCAQLEQLIEVQDRKYDALLQRLHEDIRSIASMSQPKGITAVESDAGQETSAHQAIGRSMDSLEDEITSGTPLIRDRYEELFQMHEQGKSIDFIAKKSGLNKGEVQLILQLSRQEERHRV